MLSDQKTEKQLLVESGTNFTNQKNGFWIKAQAAIIYCDVTVHMTFAQMNATSQSNFARTPRNILVF